MPGRQTVRCRQRGPGMLPFRVAKVLGPGNRFGEHEEGGMTPQFFLPRNLVNPFPSLQKGSSAYAHPLIENQKSDSKNITCAGAPVNNYLGVGGRDDARMGYYANNY